MTPDRNHLDRSVTEFGVCPSCGHTSGLVGDFADLLEASWSHDFPLGAEDDVLRVGLEARELGRAHGLESRRCQELFVSVSSLAVFVLQRSSAGHLELVLDRLHEVLRVTVSHPRERTRAPQPSPAVRQSAVVPTDLGSGLAVVRRFADALTWQKGNREVRISAFFRYRSRDCRCACPVWAVETAP